ncbi:MAG: hypothetical protein LBP35_06720 [Candidatus Ancillula trichonymphae]|jgi:hypothetical protein|nr:hypothetical protein [Candidatus Ancillula trichonymphae]
MFKRVDKPGAVDTSSMTEYEKVISYNWYRFGADLNLGKRIGEVMRALDELNELVKSGSTDLAFSELRELIPGIDETCRIVFPIKVEYPERQLVHTHLLTTTLKTARVDILKLGKTVLLGRTHDSTRPTTP